MKLYRIICPDCGETIVTTTRLAAILEDCPKCKHHVWDLYDALLADHYSLESGAAVGQNMMA